MAAFTYGTPLRRVDNVVYGTGPLPHERKNMLDYEKELEAKLNALQGTLLSIDYINFSDRIHINRIIYFDHWSKDYPKYSIHDQPGEDLYICEIDVDFYFFTQDGEGIVVAPESAEIWILKPSEEEKQEAVKMKAPYPVPGRKYKHYKGGSYTVDSIAIFKSYPYDGEAVVTYHDDKGGTYARRVSDWLDPINGGTDYYPRFQLED